MADASTQSIVVAAPVARVAAVICDFTRYPSWVSAVKAAEVLAEYEDGYASQVRYRLDAGVFSDEYTLVYEYAEDLSRIQWRLAAPSAGQRAQQGSYDLVARDDGGTTVTYTLSVEPAVPLPGFLRRRAEKSIMDAALRDLKRQVERGSGG